MSFIAKVEKFIDQDLFTGFNMDLNSTCLLRARSVSTPVQMELIRTW